MVTTGKGPGLRKGTEMNTITKTTAQAVSRKLSSLNFQKANEDGIGFAVFNTNGPIGYGFEIAVIHTGYAPSTASKELAEAGYSVRVVWTSFDEITSRYNECFEVDGRVEA